MSIHRTPTTKTNINPHDTGNSIAPDGTGTPRCVAAVTATDAVSIGVSLAATVIDGHGVLVVVGSGVSVGHGVSVGSGVAVRVAVAVGAVSVTISARVVAARLSAASTVARHS